MALTDRQREELAQILERERRKLVRSLRRYGENMGDAAAVTFSQHMAESASALTERETAALMANEEGRRLLEVNRALDRLDRSPESFGRCASCGREIGFERLEALPAAELCIECKREEESGSGRRE